MVSIIVPVRYRPDLTRVCLDSIFNYTQDFELIVVQEGEDEAVTATINQTIDLAKQYQDFFPEAKSAKYLQNKEPKGFSGAMNTGLKAATGDYVCFLNNDTVVVPGWMDEMLKVFADDEVGLVSPTFWGAPGRQSVTWNGDRDIEMVWDPFNFMGVCFLIPRVALEKVGQWDEQFGIGGGEDYDMAIRIQNAGYKLAIARKSFIYHYGGASFKELFGEDWKGCVNHARMQFEKLEKKHNIQIFKRDGQ